jgi:hypothetical protein
MPPSNVLFRHEVQSNKAASDKHKRNEALTFNQQGPSSPCAPTIKINELETTRARPLLSADRERT